ncbi:SDR family NAD(P)-dependent oxidoreductase [Glycomyces sp. NRRL B-16210]|uniref:SDR family NAD(P)-dependent oxidoreductase n=1 Tax=Glycomyces sp. NRRL B-16210 TaxID=1463821 RepID=UPI0004BE66A5|nr:SDR family NAD(P)-dependent oxidoreductase [Glycomyces sp. NRRL B-16210]
MTKTWFITGSSRGLGRAFAEAALGRGDSVAATARNPDALKALVRDYGESVLPLALDVTDRAAVTAAVDRAKFHFGHIDVVVNNAGYGLLGAVEELTERDLRDQMETNFFGAVWVAQAALPHLRGQDGGHLIQFSSAAGVVGMALGGGYAASKWALEGLSETLAQEVAGFGVKVTVVEPGGYRTEGAAGAVHAEVHPAYAKLRAGFAAHAAELDLGDPAAAGAALLALADAEEPPLRVFFGVQGLPMVEPVYTERLKTWRDWQGLSTAAHGTPEAA